MSDNRKVHSSVGSQLLFKIKTADMRASKCVESVAAINTALEEVLPGTEAVFDEDTSSVTWKFPAGTNVSELTFEQWQKTVDDRWGHSMNEEMRGCLNDPVVAVRLDSDTHNIASVAIVSDTTAGTDNVIIVQKTEGWLNKEGTRAGFNSLANCSGLPVFTGPGKVRGQVDDGGYYNVCSYMPDEEQSTDMTKGGAWGQYFFS